MKRTPLKRKTPLRRVSKKRQRINRVRRKFTRERLEETPLCELRSPVCTRYAQALDEALKRSGGGAIVPGEQADRQGQRFYAACHACNTYKEDHPKWARDAGFTISKYAK